MTKTTLSIAALLFTASAGAAPLFDGNVDVEGTALNGVESNRTTAVEPGIGDIYGSLFYFPDSVQAGAQAGIAGGSNDTYGSVLHDAADLRW